VVQDIEQQPDLVARFEEVLLKECKIRIPAAKPAVGRNSVTKTFAQRVKSARCVLLLHASACQSNTVCARACACMRECGELMRTRWYRLNRTDSLHILENYDKLFNVVSEYASGKTKDYVDDARAVWALFYPLATLAAQARVTITPEEWKPADLGD
jgi:hypothetical protein